MSIQTTRSSTSNNVYLIFLRLEIQKISISRIGAELWNEIPSSLRELPKKFSKDEDEDSFVETGHRIISNLKC